MCQEIWKHTSIPTWLHSIFKHIIVSVSTSEIYFTKWSQRILTCTMWRLWPDREAEDSWDYTEFIHISKKKKKKRSHSASAFQIYYTTNIPPGIFLMPQNNTGKITESPQMPSYLYIYFRAFCSHTFPGSNSCTKSQTIRYSCRSK